jgi:sarcosine oxidase delta subunit
MTRSSPGDYVYGNSKKEGTCKEKGSCKTTCDRYQKSSRKKITGQESRCEEA